MAQFNPDVPKGEPPSYLGYSKPIEQPAVDQTLSTLFKGVGDIFSNAVKGGDEIVKDKLQNEIYAKADTQRQIFTSDLENVRGGGKATTPGLVRTGESVDVPDSVEVGIDQAESLASARANGKVSPTYYWGRLNELAKSLRAQYPGYRDYIDQQFSSITGQNPANAYVSALSGDINAAQTSANSERNKINALFNSPEILGNPAVREFHALWAAGLKSPEEAWQFISRNQQRHWEVVASNNSMTLLRNNKEFIADKTSKEADLDVAHGITNHLDTLTLPNGQNAYDFIGKAIRGEVATDDTQMHAITTYLRSKRTELDKSIWADWSVARADGGSKMTDMGGSKAARERLDNNMKVYDNIISDLADNNFGAAFMQKNFVSAKIDSAKARWLSDTQTGDFATKLAVINGLAGPNYVKDYFTSVLGDKDLPDQLRTYFENKTLDLHTQINPLNNLPIPPNSPAPPSKTFDGVIKEAKDKGLGDTNQGSSPKDAAAFNKNVLKQINTLTASKAPDELKLNIAKAAFDPKGRGLLENFSPEDARDVYDKFTNKAVTNEMKRLGDQHGSKIWTDYKDTVDTWFSRVVFRNDILQLNNIGSNPAVKIGWDSEAGQFIPPRVIPGQVLPGDVTDGQILQTRRTLNLLNQAITNYKNVVDADKGDINAEMIRIFQGTGVDFKNIPPTMTGAALRALITANTPQEKKKP